MVKHIVRLAIVAGMFVAASPVVARAACWNCAYVGGIGQYECQPTQQFGWRTCTAYTWGCTLGSQCGLYFAARDADGTRSLKPLQQKASGRMSDSNVRLATTRAVTLARGRTVARACDGSIVSRAYDQPTVASLRASVRVIRV